MHSRILSFGIALLLAGRVLEAESSDERYVRIYNLIQDADAAIANGQTASGLDRYQEAQRALEAFQSSLPDWNAEVIRFRLKYVSEKLHRLRTDGPALPAAVTTPNAATNSAEGIIQSLKEQIRQMAAESETLRARLKEALAAQPATVDSRELARSDETVKALQKELEVLKIRLGEAESKPDRPVSLERFQETLKDLEEARQAISEQVGAIASLNLEKQALQTRILGTDQAAQFKALNDDNLRLKRELEQLKLRTNSIAGAELVAGQFGSLQNELRAQQARNEILEAERKILEDRAARLEKNRDADIAEATREIDKALKEARSAVQAGNATVLALQESLRASQEARELLGREKAGQEGQLASVRSALASERLARVESDAAARNNAEQLVRTQRERDDLKGQVMTLSKALSEMEIRLQAAETGRGADLSVALVSARRSGGVQSSPQGSSTTSIPIAGPARTPLDAATRSNRSPATSESPANLAHLAAIQMDQNRLAEADATLKSALAKDPGNVMGLLTLGRLNVRRGDFESAVDSLSRAAQRDPQNAEVCNYLGVALMEKGLREPAEFALSRAVRLSPGYADAHFNLAVFYLRQRPQVRGKAADHYQKSLASGHASDSWVEGELKQGGALGSR